jgi:hypothetical protein
MNIPKLQYLRTGQLIVNALRGHGVKNEDIHSALFYLSDKVLKEMILDYIEEHKEA